MARYDYKCSKCEHVFEVQHSIHEEPKVKCEKCKKLICNECNHCSNNCLLKSQRIDMNKNNPDFQYEQYPEAQ